MAGLDNRRQSDFISMLLDFSKNDKQGTPQTDPVLVCTEISRTLEMISETLLLKERDQPLSKQPFSGCCDTIVAKRKSVSIAVNQVESTIKDHGPSNELCRQIAALAEGVSILVETTAQAVFMIAEKSPGCKKAVPSAVDIYPLARGRLAIQLAVDLFSKNTVSVQQTLSISAVIATHLEAMRGELNRAAKEMKDEASQIQIKGCVKGLSGAAAMIVPAFKKYVNSGDSSDLESCKTFTSPLLATIDATVQYVEDQASFIGTSPQMTREIADYAKPIQAAGMSLVSSCTLFIRAAKNALVHPQESKAPLNRYAGGIDEALEQLCKCTKDAQKAKIMFA